MIFNRIKDTKYGNVSIIVYALLQFTAHKIIVCVAPAPLGNYIYLRFCPVHYVQKENLKHKTEPLSLRQKMYICI